MSKGDDVRRWRIEDKKQFLIVTRIGVAIKQYPAIFEHLKRWQPQLEKRQDQGNHWWELRACAYYDLFDKPKIVFPEIAKEARFAFDSQSFFVNNKAFMIPRNDYYLLAIMNSASCWEAAKTECSVLGDENAGGRVMLQWINFQRVPIPAPGDADKNAIEELVAACLQKRGQNCGAEEAEINARVAKLYGL